ncbi:hypothetical protein Ait01nite_030440 [Actinoplanes italicus]|uniref:Uncharacterized protein n=1 Tax=Actinoplanes italicus TaxID=113567 RepID=A0A2T0KJ00_9ACTN|nr:hypothetical protein CLV67_103251 [Actinoplanes italicus]GIE29999.1 hypothetical protein Ait01nite_030440 [Actinoplanes italicus]
MSRRGGGPDHACKSKHPYPTRASAAVGMSALARRTGTRYQQLNVYRCPYASHWHVGHKAQRRRR